LKSINISLIMLRYFFSFFALLLRIKLEIIDVNSSAIQIKTHIGSTIKVKIINLIGYNKYFIQTNIENIFVNINIFLSILIIDFLLPSCRFSNYLIVVRQFVVEVDEVFEIRGNSKWYILRLLQKGL